MATLSMSETSAALDLLSYYSYSYVTCCIMLIGYANLANLLH